MERLRHLATCRGLVSAFVILTLLFPLATSTPSLASTSVRSCSAKQVTVALESPAAIYAFAANEGFAFLVVNVSHTACSIKGYPKLQFLPASYEGKADVVATTGVGQVFVRVPPRNVVIEPGATASFGLNYVDAANQEDPGGGPCLTRSVSVRLPVSPHHYSAPRTVAITLNFCFAGFRFGVTSIQHGPLPETI